MRTNKLVSSMATTLATLFVLLAPTGLVAYETVRQVMSGAIGGGSFMGMILLYLPLAIALFTFVTLVLAIVGAVKAVRNPSKGLFVTIAVFQFLLLLFMGFYGGYYIYQSLATPISLIELVVYVYAPYLIGALALLVAFIQTCKGVKRQKEVAAAPVEETPATQAPRQGTPFPPPPPPRG